MLLRYKFTLFLLIVGLLPLAIMGGHSLVRVESIVRETKEQALLSLGTEVGSQIRRLIREGYSSVLQLSENPVVHSGVFGRDDLRNELVKTQHYHPIIRDLTLVGSQGEVKSSVFFSFRGDWRSTSWYHAAQTGKALLSEVHAILHPFHVVMTVAVPIKDGAGAVRDILFGQLDMVPIMEVLGGVDLGPGGRALLVDERSVVVASAIPEEILEPLPFAPYRTSVARGPFHFRHAGQQWVGVAVPIDESGEILSPDWRLLLLLPVEHAYQAMYSMRTGLIIAGLCSLLFVLILSSAFSRHIGRRIGSLSLAAKELGNGMFKKRLEDLGCDEIGELGRTFNWAGEQLAISRDQIRRYHENLEQLVEERTRELRRANAELKQEIEERKRGEEERRALEDQLRQSQKMEALGTLAGGVAHDFNNLLQGIAGTNQLLLMRKAEGDPDRPHLLELDRMTARASDLVCRLLAFSRKMDSAPGRMVLNDAVQNVTMLLQRTIPKSVTIHEELDPRLGAIIADQTQMEQVLINLAGNAVDAMPEGGTLTIRTVRLAPSAGCPPLIRLSVSDTGGGMRDDVLRHIFEPFYTTKPIGKGTGLGLSTVYGIVKEHGGTVSCSSLPGRGSVFEVLLPAAAETGAEQHPECPLLESEVAGGSETILVVDDEEVIREVVEEVLEHQGYTVLQAESAERALELLKRGGRVDLVITDLGMPGMGGEQLLKELEAMRPSPRIIVSSGYAAHPLFESGDTRYYTLRKPYHLTELLRAVRDVLDRRATA
jgi:signal transduction histidine kinase/CheY-like chemotaxis protein